MRSELCKLTHSVKLLVERLRKLQLGGHDPPAIEAVKQRLADTRRRVAELKRQIRDELKLGKEG